MAEWQALRRVRGALILVGLALLALGCWFVYQPAAAIVPGAILVLIAIVSMGPGGKT